ncbi:MAG: rhodanese-like domain-containing protein, partial [Spongiibacteraceae bacterium]
MNQFKHLSPADAYALFEQDSCQFADIRDEQSFALGHIPNARHVDNQTLQQFIE